jgi:hypothetical protein
MKFLQAAIGMVVGAVGLLASTTASAKNAVIYVHGTADWNPGGVYMNCNGAQCVFDPIYWGSSSACGTYSCGLFGWFTCDDSCWLWGSGAAENYWESGNVSSMANGENYLVVSYQGLSNAPTVGWGQVVDQIQEYVQTFGITDITIVTHSDGANVIRYAEAHPTQPSPTGSGNTWNSAVGSRLAATILMAGTNKGTPLADEVYTLINLPIIGDIADLLIGSAGYVGPAVLYQEQANMQAANYNWTFGATPDEGQSYTSYWLNGAYLWDFAGQGTSYNVFGGQCDSYWEAFGLWTVSGLVGWNWYGDNPSGNTDGFVGQDSATYIGMQWMTSNNQQNHNQSRRACGSVAPEEQYILYGVNNYGW